MIILVTAMQVLLQQVGITLPIVIAIAIAAWLQTKRLDTIEKRIDDVRLEIRDVRADVRDIRTEIREVKEVLRDLDHRVTTIEERTRPIVRG